MSQESTKRRTTASTPGAWDQMLKAVLLPNEAAHKVRDEPDGSVTLAVPTRSPKFLFPPFSWLIRPPKERLTVLDPIGATIWRSCDGTRTVEEIVEIFAIRYRLSFHESRVSVTGYVKSLLQRGALAVSIEHSD